MSFEKPLPIIAALIALVLGASVAGFLLTKRRKQFALTATSGS